MKKLNLILLLGIAATPIVVTAGKAGASKEKALAQAVQDIRALRKQVQAAPANEKRDLMSQEEVIRERLKRMSGIGKKELDLALGEWKETKQPGDVTRAPVAQQFEILLQVPGESRGEVPRETRMAIFKRTVAQLGNAADRKQIVALLKADADLTDEALTNKLRAQIGLAGLDEGSAPHARFVASQAKLVQTNQGIKNLVKRESGLELDLDLDLQGIALVVRLVSSPNPTDKVGYELAYTKAVKEYPKLSELKEVLTKNASVRRTLLDLVTQRDKLELELTGMPGTYKPTLKTVSEE